MREIDAIGSDGKLSFCKSCGRTFKTFAGAIGHQRSCPARKRGVKKYSVRDNRLGNYCDTKMSAARSAPSAQTSAQLSAPSARSSAQNSFHGDKNSYGCDSVQSDICDSTFQYETVLDEKRLLELTDIIQRTYSLEQKFEQLDRHVNNDLTHLSAVGQEEWVVSVKKLVFLVVGAGAIGWILHGVFYPAEEERKKNPTPRLGDFGKKVGDRLVERGVNKVIDNVFRRF